ncbi:MAG: YggS family pyridoxal phosphate-dependent enzyme [Treponema sp.]|nr:YggS family pyridoxal phosphate-dependent enzyme [Spirochaetia bacterium]MDD6294955.1 YggS family pyridoxal phosphate-dependent enzyme [Treponema sp.]
MDNSKEIIRQQLALLKQEINDAEKQSGRPQGCVKLQAVSKFHPVQSVLDAISCGQILFGENRVQEAKEKFEEIEKIGCNFDLHIIGSLQRNKVKNAVKIASCIESVDRIELLEEIEKQCAKTDRQIQVLFEFHTAEDSKSGFQTLEELEKALLFCAEGKAPHVIPKGFMTMAPFTTDEKLIHDSFSTMRETAEKMKKEFSIFDLCELSMGMSGDFKIAIQEGSTQVRIGTAIFGNRDYQNA